MKKLLEEVRCVLITPSVLHVDTEETIMVSIEGSTFSSFEIIVQDFPEKRFILAQSQISLNKDNHFIGKATIKVKNYNHLPYDNEIVPHGYIFIQTDKPIYTPASKLLYRIFPLNNKLQPVNTSVTVEFRNPDGIIVKSETFKPDTYGFASKTNDLSELGSLGTWTLLAKYEGSSENFSTNFEVKEYVLPSFEVTIKTKRSFMYLEEDSFPLTINAQYIYGKPVSGKAFVLFRLKKGQEEKSLTRSLRRIEIVGGSGEVSLLRGDLMKDVMHPDDLLQYRLHASVTVVTDSGGDLVEAELGNIFIVKSPYKILFTRTPKYFKPGLPFDLTVMVTNPDGSPAGNIMVVADPGAVTAKTQSDGTARIILNTDRNARTLDITVKTAESVLKPTEQASGRLSVEAYKASNGQKNYLHISIDNDLLHRGKQVFVKFIIQNNNEDIQKKIQQFIYLILSRGKIVTVGRQERAPGQTVVTMPLVITQDLLPSFRIVAYYTLEYEMVSDSMWVDVVDDCMGTLELKASKTTANPRDKISFTLRADYNSSVGLVAVDKAVYALNNKYRMTQSKGTHRRLFWALSHQGPNLYTYQEMNLKLPVTAQFFTKTSKVHHGFTAHALKVQYMHNFGVPVVQEIWNTVEKSDTGCSPGSGANNMGVFYDAGLAVQTNFGLDTEQRTGLSGDGAPKTLPRGYQRLKDEAIEDWAQCGRDSSCGAGKNRRRRSTAELKAYKSMKASNYSDLEQQCCHDGMVRNPMDHSCERRARLIQEGDKCVNAFLDCCRSIELKRKADKEMKDEGLERKTLAKSQVYGLQQVLRPGMKGGLDHKYPPALNAYSEVDDEYYPDKDIDSRTDFPESWLWNIVNMNMAPDADNISTEILQDKHILKDSITTWEVLAISLSKTKGICVAQPTEIQVLKDFFVDLKLPYSVARNEQVEIRAIMYNYMDKNLKVRISFSHNPEFCSLSTRTKKYTKDVTVKKHSSFAVPFVIVPLTVGQHYVEVKASVFGLFVGDGVRKLLKVVPEGIRKTVTLKSVILDPKGKSGEPTVTIPSLTMKNVVPHSTIVTKIIVQGSPISQLVENAIDGSKLNSLIIVPDGCAEQNMESMTPVVIATHYLDKTNQWEQIGLHRREVALWNIKKGYTNQLRFRRPGGSYGAFTSSANSTWLTAYVGKVFAMASGFTEVDRNIICGSIKWLVLNTQKPDGLFQDKAPISEQYLSGGLYNSSDPDVALTAFVVIALLESQEICSDQVHSLQSSIDKAVRYLQDHYQPLTRPHSIAITSYALALAGRLQNTKKLLSAATDLSHWDESGSLYISLEATSYALLTLLHLESYDLTDALAHWLTEQRYYGAVYGSTQATIVLFQALAKYHEVMVDRKLLNVKVSYKLPGRSNTVSYQFHPENALFARSDEKPLLPRRQRPVFLGMTPQDRLLICQSKTNEGFQVETTGQGQVTLTAIATYYEIVTEKEKECNNFRLSVTVKDEPYRKTPEGALGKVSITICFRHLKPVDATMSILDISMMTGFTADINDLKKLKVGVDRYISDFECNKEEYDKSTVIIYLDRVRGRYCPGTCSVIVHVI
ncbi:venom factor-like [Leptodactylus fuscus]